MQAEPASVHLLWAWVGCTTFAMGSGIFRSLAQTCDTAWGYSGLSSSQCSPPQLLHCTWKAANATQGSCHLALKFWQVAELGTLTSLGVLYPSRRKRQQP